MLLKTPSILDTLVTNGAMYHFMGANKAEKTFRLMDENGNALLIKCEANKNKYTAFIELEDTPEKPPRGMSRSICPVRLWPYDKEDTKRGLRAASTEWWVTIEKGNITPNNAPMATVSEPIWIRGYNLVDMRNGQTCLQIGHFNYKSLKGCRPVFDYSPVMMPDDEEDTADDE